MVPIKLPRFCRHKETTGGVSFYWDPPSYWKKQTLEAGKQWPFGSVPLGLNLSQSELDAAAKPHNGLFDEWRFGVKPGDEIRRFATYGTVEWLFAEYQRTSAFLRRVSERARPDYRRLYDQISAVPSKSGVPFGKYPVGNVTPALAEKIYEAMIEGEKFRRGEKALMYAKTAWKLMQPLHPKVFRLDVPNPWVGIQTERRVKLTKSAVNRDMVYTFANAALEQGRPEVAAAAVICFEWLQRPENVIGGYVRWTDYTPGVKIRIEHHKNKKMIEHPLSEVDENGELVLFYAEAEEVLAALPKRDPWAMIVGPEGQHYQPSRFAQLVRRVADNAELPKSFTLDACRHGGMTELEEAELTDGQGRALSAHSSKAYDGYAKRTQKRMLAATRRRHAFKGAASA